MPQLTNKRDDKTISSRELLQLAAYQSIENQLSQITKAMAQASDKSKREGLEKTIATVLSGLE